MYNLGCHYQSFLNDLNEQLVNAREHITNRAKQLFLLVILNELNDPSFNDHELNEPSLSEPSSSLVQAYLRRYEERHHAAQRENNERFAQIQDAQRESNERSMCLEESTSKLLERKNGHSSRSSSRSSHHSDARSKAPSEVCQGPRQRQEIPNQELHRHGEDLDPQ